MNEASDELNFLKPGAGRDAGQDELTADKGDDTILPGKKEFFKAPERTEGEETAHDTAGRLYAGGGRDGLPDRPIAVGWGLRKRSGCRRRLDQDKGWGEASAWEKAPVCPLPLGAASSAQHVCELLPQLQMST